MKKTIFVSIMFLSFVLLFSGCSGNGPKNAPLQQDMTLTYSKSLYNKGKKSTETVTLNFKKVGDNLFNYKRTVTEPNTPVYHADPIQVTGYLKYNKVMDVLIGGNNLWWDPKRLASGKMGKLEVKEGTYNGKNVYVLNWSSGTTSYYAKDTGFCEGSVWESKKVKGRKETITRIN